MPKNLFVDPNAVRSQGKLSFKDIEMNTYSKSVDEEKQLYTAEEFKRIYRDMKIIREFETMLYNVKTYEEHDGIKHKCLGPTHLALGQEAVAVGQAFILDKDDYIFGTHRNHGEGIAKGLSAIEKLSDAELFGIMRDFNDGTNLKEVIGEGKTVKETAIDFLLYGMLTEIFAKETGFNKGLGGSMHVFFTPFGIYPNNAIVGGAATIGAGAALHKKVNGENGLCIVNLGDGSLGRGPVWEAMNFSAMDQFTELWDEAHNGGLPIIFNFNNNFYGMGGQTVGETMAYNVLARVGAGISPTQLHSERIDGNDPLAVIDAMKRKTALIKEGKGPVLLDTVTYRTGGHSNTDKYTTYRTEDELNAWLRNDPIAQFREKLVSAEIATAEELDATDKYVQSKITEIFRLSVNAPDMDLIKDRTYIERLTFSNTQQEPTPEKSETLTPLSENPRIKAINERPRSGADGINIKDSIFEAISEAFVNYPNLIGYGEDVRDWGGAYGVYNGLTELLPYHRLFNAPISEAAIIGSGVGYAMCGGRALLEIMYSDFIGCAADELFNQLAKWCAMSAGELKMPVVVRVPVGSKYGSQHAQDWSSLCAHIPGLKCVFPVTPYDAKGLMTSALKGNDPVVFFESQKLYGKGEVFRKEVPEGHFEIPLGEPDVKREGKDLTILSVGAVLYEVMKAAEDLEKYGISAEVIDARSIVPFNYEKLIESVKKTGKIVLCSDAVDRGSFMKTAAANISELAFDYLEKPPIVIASRNWLAPPLDLEDHFYPQAEWILDAIHQRIIKLDNYIPKRNFTPEERIRREKLGV